MYVLHQGTLLSSFLVTERELDWCSEILNRLKNEDWCIWQHRGDSEVVQDFRTYVPGYDATLRFGMMVREHQRYLVFSEYRQANPRRKGFELVLPWDQCDQSSVIRCLQDLIIVFQTDSPPDRDGADDYDEEDDDDI